MLYVCPVNDGHCVVVPVIVPGVAGVVVVTVIFAPLSVPITEGKLLMTLIRYPVPAAVAVGIVAEIVPELALLTKVPIVVGAAKEPEALDNCAV